MKVLISACLLNLPTRYNGESKIKKELVQKLKEKDISFVPLCSEQLGGLCTPREPSEIETGKTAKDVIEGKAKVFTKEGKDLTEYFLKGSHIIVNFCKEFNITEAVLEERSPSCGVNEVYSGKFDGKLIPGRGVLAELLTQNGIKVFNTEDFLKRYL